MRKTLLSSVKVLAIFLVLTFFTQIGGVIYLLYKSFINKLTNNYAGIKKWLIKVLTFILLYVSIS